MNRKDIISALCTLNKCDAKNICDQEILQNNITSTINNHNITLEEVIENLPKDEIFNNETNSIIWKYVATNSYLLLNLKKSFEGTSDDDVLSVQQNKLIRDCLNQYCAIGIRSNLIPKVPFYLNSIGFDLKTDFERYEVLLAVTYTLYQCLKCTKLRLVIIAHYFEVILSAMYQIIYSPIKKPSSNAKEGEFNMTAKIYERLLSDKKTFSNYLDDISQSTHRIVYAKETMVIFQQSAPVWFKKAASANLTMILCSPKGLETVIVALLDNSSDYDPNDSAKAWKVFDIVVKLVKSLENSPKFPDVFAQVNNLISLEGEHAKAFESIYIACAKSNVRGSELVDLILKPLTDLSITDTDRDITEDVHRSVRIIHHAYIVSRSNYPDLPLNTITPVINILFDVFSTTIQSKLCDLNYQAGMILGRYLEECRNNKKVIYDALFFNEQNQLFSLKPKDVTLELRNERIIIKKHGDNIKRNLIEVGDSIIKLLRNNGQLLMDFFVYLLSCLNEKDKYFVSAAKKDLLKFEDALVLDEAIERNLAVYDLLAKLSDDPKIQTLLNTHSASLVSYIDSVLQKAVEENVHMSNSTESSKFESLFVITMTLQALITNCDTLEEYKKLIKPLKHILTQCVNEEFRALISDVVEKIERPKTSHKNTNKKEKSEVDKAIDDVCDPLLPVRGHGLMALTKLVEKKDADTMERKLYILNIFQQNLKNEDTFIYLAAINGLAAMGDVFPDVVIRVLTEEYTDFDRKNTDGSNELRMKIGEALVRISKSLGGMAPKYKSILLNTFLNGCKDDDHLIRTSSLSNLGEICRVLGYSLGSILTEVLVCVHAIITTDKAVEARRAAVMVIKQLFAGLESEMVAFLKDDILEIYRTLKNIYYNDKDDVMRLQAQLALEELNENIKKFVFPNPQLNFESKIVLL